jgi:CRP-like cAMP-binding protein
MHSATSPTFRNGNLLLDLRQNERDSSFFAHAKCVQLDAEQTIYEFDDSIRAVYFPLDAVVSSCSLMEDGSSAEVCLTGREGVVGISAIFDRQTARHWTNVLIAGTALRIETAALREIIATDAELQHSFLRFYRQLMSQVSQRAVCSGRHTLLQRFCFWLLLVSDRVPSDEIPLTHETIARKLGARRAGVTNVAGALQETGAIHYSRGMIQIINRAILENEVCECYRAIKEAV